MAKIKAGEQNLDKVFQRHYFEIPTYQRPYSWGIGQVDDLLDDLLGAMDRGIDEPYFLGSIVLIKESEQLPDSEVIDGQQRLTTLTMLLCVLHEMASDAVKPLLYPYIWESDNQVRGTTSQVRVNLRPLDRKFFQDYVQTPGNLNSFLERDKTTFETDSQRLIQDNVRRIKDRLADLDEATRETLARYITQKCYLVVVTTSDKSSAFRIFFVLNDRGMSLTVTDILKADIIGAMKTPEEEREYGRKWEGIEQKLRRGDFQNLFGHLRVAYLKTRTRRALQDDFQGEILPKTTPKKFMDEVLPQYADAYMQVSRASYGGETETSELVNRYLAHLRRVGNSDWIPPAMEFFKRNEGYPDTILRFTKDLERLAYALYLRRANVNERTGRYVAVLQTIEEENDGLWREDGPLQLSSDEQAQMLSILDGPLYNRTILLRLDSLLVDAGASYYYPTISVEHVLPQHPPQDSQWMQWFPDDEERAYWTHRLANLVLLSRTRNYRAFNHEFERKKTEYFQRGNISPFAITTQVLNEREWTPAVLERRQRALIDALKAEWRLG